jgi:hypothetical protein
MNTRDAETISKIADIIEANPGCEINIDNDTWSIYSKRKSGDDDEDQECLARSDEFGCSTDFYSYGNLYGAAITEAFIELLRRRGVEINASAV